MKPTSFKSKAIIFALFTITAVSVATAAEPGPPPGGAGQAETITDDTPIPESGIASITFLGNTKFTSDELLTVIDGSGVELGAKPGPDIIGPAMGAIVKFYRDNGENLSVSPNIIEDPKGITFVQFIIDEDGTGGDVGGLVSSGGVHIFEERPTISNADRAMAVIEVQNCYSKHAYYHAIGAHCEELADIWVKEDGEYAETAHWIRMGSLLEEGMDLIKQHYCIDNEESKKEKLEMINKYFPEVENVPENLGIGYGYTIHTQTTPIIVIADDGMSAKGIWYSPGIGTNVDMVDGKPVISGSWFFEKYAVDFVFEDGEWKIWHMVNVMDPTPTDWGRDPLAGQGGGFEGGAMGGDDTTNGLTPVEDPYESWSPTTKSKIYPRFPEPYYTFSETFSY